MKTYGRRSDMNRAISSRRCGRVVGRTDLNMTMEGILLSDVSIARDLRARATGGIGGMVGSA